MLIRIGVALLAVVIALPAAAVPPRHHVRAITDDGPGLGAALEAEGFDVLEGGVEAGAVELVVTDAELAALRARAQRVDVLATGRPFREIQAEWRAAAGGDQPPGYPTLDEVYQRMQDAAARRPDLCRFVDLTAELGTPPTEEGRHLFAVKISRNVELEEDEPAAMLVSLHHAREIVTPVIALHAMDQFVDGYGVDPELTEVLDTQEVWIAPIWNPDGYVYVFEHDNTWRKNRRDNGDGTFGVDQNRNYPFGWATSSCAGATRTSSDVYKGPAEASEPETQTMMAWSERERFARVLDFHSFGRETLYAYRCLAHPLVDFLKSEAEQISAGADYGSRTRPPSADGEHYQWQLSRGVFAFLTETHTTFQPPFESAQIEAKRVFGGIMALLQRPISLTGLVSDHDSGDALEAELALPEAPFVHDETIRTATPRGRYYLFVPEWIGEVVAQADQYEPEAAAVVIDPVGTLLHDFSLLRQLRWTFPAGLPALLASAGGDVIRVEVAAAGARAPEPATGMLHLDTGAGFEAFPMLEVSPDVYDAVTPPIDCIGVAHFFFSVLDITGRPAFAPGATGAFAALVGAPQLVTPPAFGDLARWSVESIELETGEWAFGEPLGDGERGDPVADADGDGVAWLTDPAPGNSDVDGGPTVLTSPAYDLSVYDGATLRYARWFQSFNGQPDELTVEISDDDGASWAPVEVVRHDPGGWRSVEFEIGSLTTLTDQMRIRFIAIDNPNDSVTEAGIDAFEIVGLFCSACRADLTGDGKLDFFDFLAFQNLFAAGDLRADFDGSGTLDFFDFLAFQNEFAAGCP